MKRTTKVLTFLLGILMLLSASSCNVLSSIFEKPFVPETAVELYNKINETMEGLESYSSKDDIEVTYYISSYKFDVTGVETIVYSGNENLVDTEIIIKCAEASVDEKTTGTKAYYDGKMYTAINTSGYGQKFCSEMTYEEYIEILKEDSLNSLNFSNCTTSDFAKNEDGTWSLSFSGFTQKFITQMMEIIQFTSDDLGAEIIDVEITITADESFRYKDITMDFSFDVDENTSTSPKISVKTEYSGYNETSFDVEKLKPEDYKQIDDVRILDKVEDGIEKLQNAQSGKINLEVTQSRTLLDNTDTYSEKDVISYGVKDGGYYYDIDSTADNNKTIINYAKGVQKLTYNGEAISGSQTEEDAKAFVDGLINSANYTSLYVSDVEKKEDGVYLLTVEKYDVTALNANSAETGLSYTGGVQKITVTFEGDDIKKIESTISLIGKAMTETGFKDMTQRADSNLTVDTVD